MIITLKKSSVPGRRPEQLASGELAINVHDGLLYFKDTSENVRPIGASGKIRLEASSPEEYLSQIIDGDSIKVENGKLVSGLPSDIDVDLNMLNVLKGVTGNIQEQLNVLESTTAFRTAVDTHEDLLLLEDNRNGDVVIVSNDEYHSAATTIYIYNGTDWVFIGLFSSAGQRDFTMNPLNLSTEATGFLNDPNIGSVSAEKVTIADTDGLFTSTDVEGVVKELFTYANNAKNNVVSAIGAPLSTDDTLTESAQKILNVKTAMANALVDRLVAANPTDTLQHLSEQIYRIPVVKVVSGMTRLNLGTVVAPRTFQIPLPQPVLPDDFMASVVQIAAGGGAITPAYEVTFNTAAVVLFETNPLLLFNTDVRVNNSTTASMVVDATTPGATFAVSIPKTNPILTLRVANA